MTRLLSLAWLTVSGAHPLLHIEAALIGGFDAVGLRLVAPPASDPMIPIVGDEPLVWEIESALRATGVSVLDVETVWIDPGFRASQLQPVLEIAQRLGARNLLTMGMDTDAARLTASFAALCESACSYRLNVGIEFAAYTQVQDLQAAHNLVRDAAQPNARILVDALHFARSGGHLQELARIPHERLAYCQLGDARGPCPPDAQSLRAEARAHRWLPGHGELPLLQLLRTMPPALPVSVEAPSSQLAPLSFAERARRAGEATRRLFESLEGSPA